MGISGLAEEYEGGRARVSNTCGFGCSYTSGFAALLAGPNIRTSTRNFTTERLFAQSHLGVTLRHFALKQGVG